VQGKTEMRVCVVAAAALATVAGLATEEDGLSMATPTTTPSTLGPGGSRGPLSHVGTVLVANYSHDDPFAYHKPLLPLDARDWVSFTAAAIGLIIAAGGGIGGGGILVPLMMMLSQWHPKHAIALSNITICGGAIANCLFNVQKVMPDGRTYIDWDIILIMEPSTIVGAILGSFASKYLPDFVLTVMLAVVLSLLAYRTLEKGISMFMKESAKFAKEDVADSRPSRSMELKTLVESDQEDAVSSCSSAEEEGWPWFKIFCLVLSWVGCLVFTVLKGNGKGSIVGVVCGSTLYWVFAFASIPWVTMFQIWFRKMLIEEHEEKVEHGKENDYEPFKWNEADAVWEGAIPWDGWTTIKYPLICTLSGVFAGLFGVGGGIVKGPLMLEMGVYPVVASATAATMILFTSSAACVSFYLFDMLQPHYGAVFFGLGFLCTAAGQGMINQWMKEAKRQSPPVLSIGAVLGLSTLMVSLESISKWKAASNEFDSWMPGELFQPSSLCH